MWTQHQIFFLLLNLDTILSDSAPENFVNIWQIEWNWWQCDVTTSPLYWARGNTHIYPNRPIRLVAFSGSLFSYTIWWPQVSSLSLLSCTPLCYYPSHTSSVQFSLLFCHKVYKTRSCKCLKANGKEAQGKPRNRLPQLIVNMNRIIQVKNQWQS